MDPKTVLIPGLMLAVFTLLPILHFLALLSRVRAIRSKGVRTKGIVKRVFFDDHEERVAAHLEVHYTGNNGKTYKLVSGTSTVFNLKMSGRETDVIYHLHDPSRAFIVRDVKVSLCVALPLLLVFHCAGLALVWYSLARIG